MSEVQFEKFLNTEIVITEKLDGSNICLTNDSVFSRSHSSPATHKSFDPLKKMHSYMRYEIPDGISIFGEWCYALHSIEYRMLQNYLNIFGVRDDNTGEWVDWDEVELWAEMLGVVTVPVILRGVISNKDDLRDLIVDLSNLSSVYGPEREGVVIRTVAPPTVNEVNQLEGLGKWVRENHVQTDEHWKSKPVVAQPCMLTI
jgi:hypothetical protein